jgi:hypothetical protein
MDALKGDLDAIDRAFEELKPDTKILTRAYALCLMNGSPFAGTEATRLILSALQYQVAEKTARRLNQLTWAIAGFTVILVGFGVFDAYCRLHECG